MAFNWEEYLNLAKVLQGEQCDVAEEAKDRAATSRAYYAAFCVARNIAMSKGCTIKKDGGDHGIVIDFYIHKDKRYSVGVNLRKLREWRRLCDYEDEVDNTKVIAGSSVELAKKTIQMLTV